MYGSSNLPYYEARQLAANFAKPLRKWTLPHPAGIFATKTILVL